MGIDEYPDDFNEDSDADVKCSQVGKCRDTLSGAELLGYSRTDSKLCLTSSEDVLVPHDDTASEQKSSINGLFFY